MALQCPRCHERYSTRYSQCPVDKVPLQADPLTEHDFGGRRIVDYLGGGGQGAVFKVHKPPIPVSACCGSRSPARCRDGPLPGGH